MPLRISFLGGVQTVTGSKFLLETDSTRVLVDCGLFQGLKPLRLMNWAEIPFDTRSIDAVLLTHAHLDHTGYVPRLAHFGLRAPVHCTAATADLLEILWRDAAKIQEEDAEYANRKQFSKHHPAKPLFDDEDATRALRLVKRHGFQKAFEVGDFFATFHRAGHILGSSFIEIEEREDNVSTTLVFSGDMGRPDMPLHQDPEPLPSCDTLVLESTYGNRAHDTRPLADALLEAIRPTLQDGGTVLIPAFAVARAQLITLLLNQLMTSGRLERYPVDIDSPMAVDATEIYRRYLGAKELDDLGGPGLLPPGAHLRHSVAESMGLNQLGGPRIIISASGMLTGGRVLHHLRRLGGDRRNTIVLTGYQAAGTRGRDLAEGKRTLRMHGQDVAIHAKVIVVDGFSAHADAGEIMDWVTAAPALPRTVFITHGEVDASDALAERLRAAGMTAITPALGQGFEWIPKSRAWRQVRTT